jgi:hypothetical protein
VFAVSTSGTAEPAEAVKDPLGVTLSHDAVFAVSSTRTPFVESVA